MRLPRSPAPETDSAAPVDPWVDLAERVSVCGRIFREQLAVRAGPCEVSGPEFSLLWACRQTPPGGLAQKELAAALGVSASQISGLVDALRRRGLLFGQRAADDRRVQRWRLTPVGRATLERAIARLADWTRHFECRLGTEKRRRLLGGLSEMLEVLHEAEHAAPAVPEPTPRKKGAA